MVAPGAAAEDDGLDETSQSRFVLEAGAGAVAASVTVTIRNVQPDDGAYFYYWDSYAIPVPVSATDVRATSDGAELSVSVEPTEDPGTSLATARFSPLNYGRSRTIEWTYSVAGEPIRSAGLTRVGEGYATFPVQGIGEPGQVGVDVVLPASMTFDATTDVFTRSEEGGVVTYSTRESTDEYGIWAVVSARDPEAADERALEVGDTTLTLQSFPGDGEWADFVETQVEKGLPVLEDVIGHPWPGGLEVIREDVSPQVLGYAWFDPDADEIVIPEDLDEGLLFHELTHAWLDPVHVRERWLYEGLTEVVAEQVVARTGGTFEGWDVPDRAAEVAVPLAQWTEPMGEAAEAVDEYGYAASYTAVSELLADLDDETFTEIVAASYAGESAFEEAGAAEKNGGRTDWRRFLDLVEVRGGVGDAADVFRTWVVDGADADLLDGRADALTTYAVLDETDGPWQAPLGARSAMTHWRYAQLDDAVAALGDAPGDASVVQDAAEETGLAVPAGVREAYEAAADAEDYAAVAALLPRAAGAIRSVGQASDAAAVDRDPVSRLGELVLDVDGSAAQARTVLAGGDLDGAVGLADRTSTRAGLATWVGVAVVLLGVAVLAGAVLTVRTVRRRRAAPAADVVPDAEPGPGEVVAPAAEPEPAADVAPDTEPEPEPAADVAPDTEPEPAPAPAEDDEERRPAPVP